MLTSKFWRDALERSIATFAEAFGAYALAAGTTDVIHLDWVGAASTAGFATLLALLKALAASKVGPDENASLDPAQRTILGKA